jgi:hypothetical protein
VTKDGHYGVVSNTNNPIIKGQILSDGSRNPQMMQNSAYTDNVGAIGSFGP